MGFGAGLGVTSTPISYQLAFGTYEDALQMVGVTSAPRIAGTVVSAARIQMFAATVQDGNPSYWDVDFATRTWGGLVAPPALLMGWLTPLPWEPDGAPPVAAIALRVPLPGTTIVNAANEARISAAHSRRRPVDHRRTSGVGVTGEAVQARRWAFHRNLGHFHASGRRGGGDKPKHVVPLHSGGGVVISWESVRVPTDLPEVHDEISYQRVVMNSGSTWDYTPVHFDPYYAEKQGHPGIFVNTMHIAGFADRIATDWAGPQSRVVRRKMRLAGSIYAGDTMVGRGRVVAKRARGLVDLQIDVVNQRGELCSPVELTLQLPG